jgi:hypothetical protein
MFDLTANIEAQRKAKLRAAITVAAQMIADCPDLQKQWRAMHELRKLQQRLKYPVL